MARRKRCVVKRRRKEKRRKREEKEENTGDQIANKKSSAQSSFFGPIRNTLFRVKQTISLLFSCKIISMNKVGDFQELKIHPILFLQYFQNPPAVLRYET